MRRIIEFFIKSKNNLEKNLERYEQKEKTKQQESKIYGQKPIKNEWGGKLIEVASFKTGYVRNQNSGYSNYQLNKRCEGEPEYFDSGKKDSMGRPLYTQFSTRSCILIPIEIDRLEYLISYCLKNYYIKQANMIEDGKFVPKWKYEDLELELQDARDDYQDLSYRFEETAMELSDISVTINGHRYKVK